MTEKIENSNPVLSTPIMLSVHYKNINPIFGEGATLVSLEDEGGGAFIILSQEGVSLRFDLEELEKIVEVARGLIKGYPKDV